MTARPDVPAWVQDHPEWSRGVARHRGGASLFAHWFGAIVWNGLSVPVVIGALADEGAWSALPRVARLLFVLWVLMGLYLLVRAAIATARSRRFQDLELVLDPAPGSLGGQVGGSVELPVGVRVDIDARATLRCIHTHVEGSGESRTRRQDVVWSQEVVPEKERSGGGTRLHFVFDVPDAELPESEPDGEDRHVWTLRLAAPLPGADLDATFEIPVVRLDPPLTAARDFDPPAADPLDLPDRGITATRTGRGLELDFRRGRFGMAPLGVTLAGVTFVGLAWLVGTLSGEVAGGFLATAIGWTLAGVMGLAGFAFALFGVHLALSRRTTVVGDRTISVSSRWLFFPADEEVALDDVREIRTSVPFRTGQGSDATIFYALTAVQESGDPVLLGDGIRGFYMLERLTTTLEEETGRPVRPPPPSRRHR